MDWRTVSKASVAICVFGTVFVCGALPAQAQRLWVNDSSGRIWDYSVGGGASGRDYGSAMQDMAVNPLTGDIFGVQSDADLYRFHPTSGYVEPFIMRDVFGDQATRLNALAFRSDGALFAMGNSTVNDSFFRGLYRLDPYSGVATQLSSEDNLTGPNPGGDIAFDSKDRLFQVDYNGNFYRVDASNGNRTFLTSTGFSQVSGLAYDSASGKMIGVSRAGTGNDVFSIDLNTLAVRQIANNVTSIGDVYGAASYVNAPALTPVAMELSLVVDVSGSISSGEFARQMNGYAAAFRGDLIQNLIAGTKSGVAVSLQVFAGDARTMVDWTHLQTKEDVRNFADILDRLERPTSENLGSSTDVQDGMRLAIDTQLENTFSGALKVVDVSGDGSNFNVSQTEVQRDRADDLGITVNGIVLDPTSNQTILQAYEDHVINFAGWAYSAETPDAFADAVVDKITWELGDLAEEGSSAGIYSGNTKFAMTWNRPEETLSDLSLIGSAVPYHVQSFYTDLSGFYNFQSTALGWDNFLTLYADVFDPTNPLRNLIAANDDFPSSAIAGFDQIFLERGRQYFLVTTGFSNQDFGGFYNEITGPGHAILGAAAAPEPSSLMLVGVLLIGSTVVRNRTRGPIKGRTAEKKGGI